MATSLSLSLSLYSRVAVRGNTAYFCKQKVEIGEYFEGSKEPWPSLQILDFWAGHL
jgi:hypothetical protein